jgi:hypothetical protein
VISDATWRRLQQSLDLEEAALNTAWQDAGD